jgi:hypothetical protein
VRAFTANGSPIEQECGNAEQAKALAQELWNTGKYTMTRASMDRHTRMDAGNILKRVIFSYATFGDPAAAAQPGR